MHSTTVEYRHDSWDRSPNRVELFHCNHNGDFSGDIKIAIDPARVQEGIVFGDMPEYMEVSIPFEVVKELVAHYLRDELVRKFEDIPTDTLFQRFLL